MKLFILLYYFYTENTSQSIHFRKKTEIVVCSAIVLRKTTQNIVNSHNYTAFDS